MTPAERETALSLLKRRNETSGPEKMHATGALQKMLLEHAEFLLKEHTNETSQTPQV